MDFDLRECVAVEHIQQRELKNERLPGPSGYEPVGVPGFDQTSEFPTNSSSWMPGGLCVESCGGGVDLDQAAATPGPSDHQ